MTMRDVLKEEMKKESLKEFEEETSKRLEH